MIFAIMRSANTNKRGDGMYDTTIAAKLLSQLGFRGDRPFKSER